MLSHRDFSIDFDRIRFTEQTVQDEHGSELTLPQKLLPLIFEIGLAISGEHVGHAYVLDSEVVIAGICAESVGQIGLARAGSTDDNDVEVMRDVLNCFPSVSISLG